MGDMATVDLKAGIEGKEIKSGSTLLPEDLSFASVMKKPLIIAAEAKHPWLDIVRTEDHTAAIELLLDLNRKAPSDSIMRIAGGCKGFSPEMVDQLFEFMAKGSVSLDGQRTFKGSVGSGGTKDFNDDGTEKVMITQVPYYMARLFPCVAWGSTPQTFRARLDVDREGSVIISKYGSHLDERGHMNVVTQNSASSFQGWDGDVRWYISALESCQKHSYKTAIIAVNGGDVTKDEALLALSKGIPVILAEGSQRAADELVAAFKSGNLAAAFEEQYAAAFKRGLLDPDKDKVPSEEQLKSLIKVAQLDNPRSLSLALDELGLLT